MTAHNFGCLTSFLRFLGFPRKGSEASQVQFNEPDEPGVLPYLLRDDFLSEAEMSFFHVLKNMVSGRLLVFPKVSLGDLFYVSRPDNNFPYRNKIDRKHVDFLLCQPTSLKPLLAIELDDASHAREDRVERDRFVDQVFGAAGLPLVRVPVRPAYDTQALGEMFKDALRSRPQPGRGERNGAERGRRGAGEQGSEGTPGVAVSPGVGARPANFYVCQVPSAMCQVQVS